MSADRNDLLSVTRTLLRWGFYIGIALVLMLALLLVGVLLGDSTRINITGSKALTPEQKLFAARAGIAGALICCAVALPVLRLLLGVVDSARNSDPFVPENGARLRRIGSLMLVINIVMNISASLALRGHITFPLSLTTLMTVLMIFVLARIFDTGTRMRAELQETI
jgi:hypothetical protein